jgi:hypothetical protein
MSCKVGSTAIGEIYVGSQKIKEAYVGSTLVYQLSSPGPGPGPGPSAAWSPNPVTNLNIHAWQSPALTVSSCTVSSSTLTISLDVSNLENSYWITGSVYWRVSVNGALETLIAMAGVSGTNTWATPSPVTINVSAGDTVSLGFYAADQQSGNYGIVGTLAIS